MGFFEKLKQGLQRTKQLLQTDVRDLFRSGEILDEEKLEQFEVERPDGVKKLDLKGNLLLPWMDQITRTPRMLDGLEDAVLAQWERTRFLGNVQSLAAAVCALNPRPDALRAFRLA